MGAEQSKPAGPELTLGIPVENLPDGHMLTGHVGDDAVLLARRGNEFFAIGATCSHYGGPLAEGLMVDDTVRCPWHHACFSLRTGEALHPPALSPVACWAVEQRDGKLFVTTKTEAPKRRSSATAVAGVPERIVIIGGGAAGFAAAEKLRREQYQGSIVMLSNDDAPPVDRPNLSKDYLAGSAPEDWIPLSPDSFYDEAGIELRLNTEVTGIDTKMIDTKMIAQQPEIAKARDRRSDGDIKLIRGIGSLCRIQRLNAKVDFRNLESDGFDVEIESQLGQFLQVHGQRGVVPRGPVRELVVGQHVSPGLVLFRYSTFTLG